MKAELPQVTLEAVAGRRVEAHPLAYPLFGLGKTKRELLIHLIEISQRPLHLHANQGQSKSDG